MVQKSEGRKKNKERDHISFSAVPTCGFNHGVLGPMSSAATLL